jgi:hypothetical protein
MRKYTNVECVNIEWRMFLNLKGCLYKAAFLLGK